MCVVFSDYVAQTLGKYYKCQSQSRGPGKKRTTVWRCCLGLEEKNYNIYTPMD